ncbi:MAG TPA: aminoglycoside phosphotransferase family protein [Beutenbergiaceae bacterium]|nr:aminoglycoside phosphotransferase family protein [Beutenbergiaceae bacterium]
MFDLGPPPARILADAELVRTLIADQFPQWADLPVRPVTTQGWDNQTFHLGELMLVRMPTAAEYALAVEKEHRWLPVLAPLLPLPVPAPLAQGSPGAGFSHPWSVYGWLAGSPAEPENIADRTRLATDLAGFLTSLRSIDPATGPGPGTHNWYRGGPLGTFEAMAWAALQTLAGYVDADRVRAVWQAALNAPWDRQPVWFHGDIATGNLLVRGGELGAVIDFGTCGVGDPACDLAIAWTLLSGESRAAFRDTLGVDDDTWSRGRGWALWKALVTSAGAAGEDASDLPGELAVLNEILTDYEQSR